MLKIAFEYDPGRFGLLEALAYARRQTVAELLKSLIDDAIRDFQEKNGVVGDKGSIVKKLEDRR